LLDQAAVFGKEIAGAGVAEGPIGLESAQVGGADPAGDAVQFRLVPGNREGDGGVQQGAEIVAVVGVLPEVIGVQQQIAAEGLLQAGVELVASAGLDGN